MNKTVLLARLHPLIVQEMKPLLEQCGFGVLKPEVKLLKQNHRAVQGSAMP